MLCSEAFVLSPTSFTAPLENANTCNMGTNTVLIVQWQTFQGKSWLIHIRNWSIASLIAMYDWPGDFTKNGVCLKIWVPVTRRKYSGQVRLSSKCLSFWVFRPLLSFSTARKRTAIQPKFYITPFASLVTTSIPYSQSHGGLTLWWDDSVPLYLSSVSCQWRQQGTQLCHCEPEWQGKSVNFLSSLTNRIRFITWSVYSRVMMINENG